MNYPMLFEMNEKTSEYKVTLPDLPGCSVTSKTIDNGIDEMTKSMKSHLSILAEYGEAIPNAQSVERHREKYNLDNPHTFSNAIWSIISIDITPYLGKSQKINVTLPELLISQIDTKVSKSVDYKTRSGFIAAACLAELSK